jgi:hypothetical protein
LAIRPLTSLHHVWEFVDTNSTKQQSGNYCSHSSFERNINSVCVCLFGH